MWREGQADVEGPGAVIEAHLTVSLGECERRDRKGLYKFGREGRIEEFTDISDTYEIPEAPNLCIHTEGPDVDNCVHQVFLKLESLELISG